MRLFWLVWQADKLEHLGLGKVLPGTIYKELTVGAAAMELSAALSEIIESNALRSNCLQMQREMAAEDGVATAAAHIRQLLPAESLVRWRLQSVFCSFLGTVADCCKNGCLVQVRPANNKYGTVELPNGWEVHASSRSEVSFLYHEIFEEQSYLQHGITVQDGDVIVDVGANIGAGQLLKQPTSTSNKANLLSFPL